MLDVGRYEEAAAQCEPALAFFEGTALERRATFARILLARIAHASGDRESALQLCHAALEKLARLDAPQLEFHARVLLARIHRDNGRLEDSYQEYCRARAAMEMLRGGIQGEELKIVFMRRKLEVYENLVEICLLRETDDGAAEAFSYMELAKSRTLLEAAVDRMRSLPWLNADHPAAERFRRLREEVNWYYRRLDIEQTRSEGVSARAIQDLWTRAREKEGQLIRTVRELPDRAETQLAYGARVLTPQELREVIGPDAVLLEYFESSGSLMAAVVGSERTAVVRLGSSAEVEQSIAMLEFQISRCQAHRSGGSTLKRISLEATKSRLHELYRALIGPLENSLGRERLVIVPHGALHRVPFHALFDGNHYLIERYAISYAPSATIYAICEKRRANERSSALLLGLPDARAPWIAQELRSVTRVLANCAVYEGPNATFDVLRKRGPASGVVHIATHGAFRADNPMFSSVTLADSYLNLYDLYTLRMPAELIALSGCATGLAVAAAADELLGLVRGLLSTGAQSLLLSLWDVHDRTTARLMASFYSNWVGGGQPKAEALRTAMLEIQAQTPHPYYWAPYVLIGKAG